MPFSPWPCLTHLLPTMISGCSLRGRAGPSAPLCLLGPAEQGASHCPQYFTFCTFIPVQAFTFAHLSFSLSLSPTPPKPSPCQPGGPGGAVVCEQLGDPSGYRSLLIVGKGWLHLLLIGNARLSLWSLSPLFLPNSRGSSG